MSTITEQALEELSPFELSLFLEQKIHENKKVTNLLNAGRGNLTGPLLLRGKLSFAWSIRYARNVIWHRGIDCGNDPI